MTPEQQQPKEYTITEMEMRQIQQDCAYPDTNSCDGCSLAGGEDDTRASGRGCNFKGANLLIDEVMQRPRPHTPAPALSCQTCVSEMAAFCSDCDRVHSKMTRIEGYDAAIARQAREDFAKDLLYSIDGETGFYVFPHPKSTAGNGLSRFVLLDDLKAMVEHLRSTTPQREQEQPR